MTENKTREVMDKYINSKHSDISMMSDDVVFKIMATGQEHHGPEEVLQMLNYFYHIAFEADAKLHNILYDEDKAVVEGLFTGKHIGEFAGIPATNKNVSVPICVFYDLENNKIKRGRVYFEIPVLMQQLNQ